jgi:hypothetical protein
MISGGLKKLAYLLPVLFAAQYAFNLRDNFALVARLNVFSRLSKPV